MSSIGQTLRNARENQGRELGDLARELCITQYYLSGIEDEDLSRLPGLFFYKSFARQYAVLLGVDAELVARQLEAITPPETSSPRPEVRMLDPLVEMTNRRFVPDIPMSWSVAGLAAVVFICSGFYSWWMRVPEQRLPQPTVQLPAPAAPVEVTSATAPQIAEGTLPTTTVANPAPATLSGIVLKLSATERTWLSISSGGKEVFSGFLQPSESKVLSGLDIATMRVGNAAGIDVRWNGKPIGPLGTRGQVLTIRFTPEDFEIVPPKDQPKTDL